MKKLLLLGSFLCFTVFQAQVITIPDPVFKAKLISPLTNFAIGLNGNGIVIDANSDGQIQLSEAQQVRGLNLSFSGISSLSGIEFFTNLQDLDCRHNLLTALNVSALINLKKLECSENQIPALNINMLTGLKYLDCNSNNLSVLDLTGLTLLETLFCGDNLLTEIEVNHLLNLQILYVHQNQLTELNVSNLTNLIDLTFWMNQIASIDLSPLGQLKVLQCNGNPITELDLSSVPHLLTLDCSVCQLTTLDVSSLTKLMNFQFSYNQIGAIDLSGLLSVETIDATVNNLTTLDFSNLPKLFSVDCSNNQLETIFAKNGLFTEMDFSDNPNLQYICTDAFDLAGVESKIASYGYTGCVANTYCSFTPGGTFYTVAGTNRFDSDSNGCTGDDIGFPNLEFIVSGNNNSSSTFIPDSSGNYAISLQQGAYTVTPKLTNPSYFNVTPAFIDITFPGQNLPNPQDFCIVAIGVHADMEIKLLPLGPARPGFNNHYKIVYTNNGNTVQSGNINLEYSSAINDLVSSEPAVSGQTQNNLSWDFTDMEPFETREIKIVFNLNSPVEIPAVNNGDLLAWNVVVTSPQTDDTPDNNGFVFNQTVVNSFDPNDKTCLEGAVILPEMVGKYVHYLIRFENTGTFAAENIVVKDIIDTTKFDISSLVSLTGSHPFETRITQNNKVEFIFQNIQLPFDDANNDGYVLFKIKTKPTLAIGDSFSNTASIYFDYNFPVITDPAITTVQVLGTDDFAFGNYFTVYPNPVSDVLNLRAKQNITVSSLSIYNVLGQQIITIVNTDNLKGIDVSGLSAGNYFIKVVSDKGISSTRFIKK